MKEIYFSLCFCLFSSSLQGMYEGEFNLTSPHFAQMLANAVKNNQRFKTQAEKNDGDCSHLHHLLRKNQPPTPVGVESSSSEGSSLSSASGLISGSYADPLAVQIPAPQGSLETIQRARLKVLLEQATLTESQFYLVKNKNSTQDQQVTLAHIQTLLTEGAVDCAQVVKDEDNKYLSVMFYLKSPTILSHKKPSWVQRFTDLIKQR